MEAISEMCLVHDCEEVMVTTGYLYLVMRARVENQMRGVGEERKFKGQRN